MCFKVFILVLETPKLARVGRRETNILKSLMNEFGKSLVAICPFYLFTLEKCKF